MVGGKTWKKCGNKRSEGNRDDDADVVMHEDSGFLSVGGGNEGLGLGVGSELLGKFGVRG
jgi:hypothetical protein